jgi:hypothetical protein
VLSVTVPNEMTGDHVLEVLPKLAIEVECPEGQMLVSHAKDQEEAPGTVDSRRVHFERR